MHALPGRHAKGRAADGTAGLEPQTAGRIEPGDARCVDLRPRPGGRKSAHLRDQILPRRVQGSRGMTKIKFELDGQQVEAKAGETIWQVAKRQGCEIPHLCYSPAPDYRPDGNCRACMVEIEGERVLQASCLRKPTAGMKVHVETERAKASRRMVFELLMADQPARAAAHDPDSKFWQWA